MSDIGSEPVDAMPPVEMPVVKRKSVARGFTPKRPSATVQMAPKEVRNSFKNPLPKDQLEPVAQSFQGIPIVRKPPPARDSLRVETVGVSGPSLPEPPRVKRSTQRKPKPAPVITPPHTKIEIPEEVRGDFSEVMLKYIDNEHAIITANPYETNTTTYMPITRKGFYRFIEDNFTEKFELPFFPMDKMTQAEKENACKKLEQADGETVQAFLYQKFVREYIRTASPYRGILVYHGLGSGKTCSAIAAAEAIYGTSNKKIIIMTPFSLRPNFMSEISFCGFRHFHTNNHWISQPLEGRGSLSYVYAESVLSLREPYLNKVLKRPEEERVIWIPDFEQPSNYNQLDATDQTHIREQLTEMIDSRIKFISYNGITASKLKQFACQVDPVTGEREFDNSVIVIDEIHNLTRLMQGNIVPYITKRKGRARKIPLEPIVPGRWKPALCGSPINYKRAYLFYRILTDARNCKIIGLSGTPIINFPEELGILANVLGGYIECAEVTLNTVNDKQIARFRQIAEEELRVDIVRFQPMNQKMAVLISVFPEGYERVNDASNDFIGVRYNELAQDGIHEVYERIKVKLLAEGIPIGEEVYVSHPRLPIDDETFKDKFINEKDFSIREGTMKVVLQKRLTGMISYYRGSKEEYMPRVSRDEEVRCEMSDYILSKYIIQRKMEIDREKTKEKEKGDAYALVEVFAKMKNPSSYRFRSRAVCNFAFPNSIDRPFPGTLEEEEEELGQDDDIEGAAPEEVEAMKEVELEEEEIERMEEEDVAASEEAVAEVAAEAVAAEAVAEEVASEQQGGAGDEVPPVSAVRRGPPPKKASAAKPAAPVVEPAVEPVVEPVAAPVVAPVVEPIAATTSSVRRGPPPKKASAAKPVEPVVEEPVVEEPVVEEVEIEEAPAPEPIVVQRRIVTYPEQIKRAMNALAGKDPNDGRSLYLNLDHINPERRLAHYSTKLDHMLRNIQNSKGSNLVYSQFKTVEGLGVLGLALKANGYEEIQIAGSDQAPYFTPQTIQSFKNPNAKRFISFTGEGSKERRGLILNVFNGNLSKLPANMASVITEHYEESQNKFGGICWVIGITGAGAEGISLKCCRSVHIMEPYWNMVRLEQVKGRAIRICSHKDLPYDQRDVDIYTYYTVFSQQQIATSKVDFTISQNDENKTSDESVLMVSKRKNQINQSILQVMKETAVDCQLNAGDNRDEKGRGVKCFSIEGRPDQYLYDPDLRIDEIETSSKLVEVKSQKPKSAATEVADDRAKTEYRITYKSIPYKLVIRDGSNDSILDIFAENDLRRRNPIGELGCDPVLFRLAEESKTDRESKLIAAIRGYKPVWKASAMK